MQGGYIALYWSPNWEILIQETQNRGQEVVNKYQKEK